MRDLAEIGFAERIFNDCGPQAKRPGSSRRHLDRSYRRRPRCWPVGGRGVRVGTSARGRRYSAFSLPGTGVAYRGRGCLVLIVAIPASWLLARWLLTSLT